MIRHLLTEGCQFRAAPRGAEICTEATPHSSIILDIIWKAMVIKLYGFAGSTACKFAAAVLYEKEIPFEYIDVDVLGYENIKQPPGQVPCIARTYSLRHHFYLMFS